MLPSVFVNVEEYQQQKAVWGTILQQMSSDPNKKNELKSDPVKFLSQAGVKVPVGVNITVVEFDPNNLYLFLPPAMSTQSGK